MQREYTFEYQDMWRVYRVRLVDTCMLFEGIYGHFGLLAASFSIALYCSTQGSYLPLLQILQPFDQNIKVNCIGRIKVILVPESLFMLFSIQDLVE